MKERFSRFINKHLRMIVVFVVIIAVAMGMLLMVISGNDEGRDNVPVDPAASQEENQKPKKERKLAQSVDHPGVSDVALNLYNARVDDISDTAQLAQLVEASDMREELGGYLVTVDTKDGKQTLVITFEREMHAGEDAALDEMAGWYAQQFLCLIEEADQVSWKYKIEKSATEIADEKAKLEAEAEKAKKEKEAKEDEESDKKKENDSKDKSDKEKTEEIKVAKYKTVKKTMTADEATEILGTEVKGYSESPELVQTLLNNQKGIV